MSDVQEGNGAPERIGKALAVVFSVIFAIGMTAALLGMLR
jgi:hypothetical protein